MKATAVSYPNIAFNKYWGNHNEALRIPLNNTISMNLEGLTTKTTVDFSKSYERDTLFLNGNEIDADRAKVLLDYVRKIADIPYSAKIVSENNFPSGAGVASSASAYSALALAACSALELKLTEKEVSSIARLGSGSACRSIPGGFAEWVAGTDHESSYAHQIAPPEHWDIRDIVVLVSAKERKVSSTLGHRLSETSPYYDARVSATKINLENIRKGILERDFRLFGETLEKDAVEMHCVAMTSKPKIFYWNPLTMILMKSVIEAREEGADAYFTTDAGPNLHIITQVKFKDSIMEMLANLYIKQENILVCKPAGKPYLTDKHLF